jgi:hypothetical protein
MVVCVQSNGWTMMNVVGPEMVSWFVMIFLRLFAEV